MRELSDFGTTNSNFRAMEALDFDKTQVHFPQFQSSIFEIAIHSPPKSKIQLSK